MSDCKWTDGPWRVGVYGPNGCYTVGTFRGMMTAMIAHSVNYEDQREEATGNAHLIASAPDLYEALVALRHEMIESGNYYAYDFDWPLVKHKVETALAKARGESYE